ncbi:MAG: pyrimidine 5'-nucleotidase [Roseinatronobacter sp.]
MVSDLFSDRDTWVFDLDNTLYPPAMRLFDQIEQRMTRYVMDRLQVDAPEANRLRKLYWAEYGTTLAGLMALHDVDPEPYMVQVHDIDFSVLAPDAALRQQIAALPGRRIVYTNGSAPYAQRVLEARGLAGVFDAVYGVEHAGYRPKPEAAAYARVFAQDGLNPARAAMFEDDPRNLAVPHALGMRTVHIAPEPHDAPFIQHHSADLTAFLALLTR